MSFLDFTGKVSEENFEYHFAMKNSNKYIKSSSVTKIRNPIVESTFYFVFLRNEKIIKNFLNSLIFIGEDEITKLTYINIDYLVIDEDKFGSNKRRIGISATCMMDKKEKYMLSNINQNQDSKILIDLELQIDSFEQDDSERFKYYLNQINSRVKADKAYQIILNLNPGKSPKNKNESSVTFINNKSAIINENEFVTIIKIDLNYCYNLLEEQKEISILKSENKLKREGEEWIKYLTIPIWCDEFNDGYYYFPNLYEKNFIKNEYVIMALLKLATKYDGAFKYFYFESIIFDKNRKIFEQKEILLEKNKEIERLKKELKENLKLEGKKKTDMEQKNKSLKFKKKNIKSSNDKKKQFKYPKEENNDEEKVSEKEEERKDSDYYPDKNDLEKEEEEDIDNNMENKMDIE